MGRDIKLAIRMLAANKGFTIVAVLTIALGVGANTTAFSFVNAILLKFSIDPKKSGYGEPATAELFDQLLRQTQRLPSVRAAGLATSLILSDHMLSAPVRVPSYQPRNPEPNNNFNSVTTDYFKALGMLVLGGRSFNDADTLGAPNVAIVNEQFVSHYWPAQNVIGRHFGALGRDIEVVGVVQTAKYNTVRESPEIAIYLSLRQLPLYPVTLHVRFNGDPSPMSAYLRDLVRNIDPRLPVFAQTLIEQRNATLSRERLLSFLSSFFGFLATALVAIGLYGLTAHGVLCRTREVGVRLALGAAPRNIRWMFIRESLGIAGIGFAIGLPAALFCSQLLVSFVFEISPRDVVALVFGVASLVVVTVLAALVPAIRGSRIDPMITMRFD